MQCKNTMQLGFQREDNKLKKLRNKKVLTASCIVCDAFSVGNKWIWYKIKHKGYLNNVDKYAINMVNNIFSIV